MNKVKCPNCKKLVKINSKHVKEIVCGCRREIKVIFVHKIFKVFFNDKDIGSCSVYVSPFYAKYGFPDVLDGNYQEGFDITNQIKKFFPELTEFKMEGFPDKIHV